MTDDGRLGRKRSFSLLRCCSRALKRVKDATSAFLSARPSVSIADARQTPEVISDPADLAFVPNARQTPEMINDPQSATNARQTLEVRQPHGTFLAANKGAFAWRNPAGGVITWGLRSYGGDSSAVRYCLKDVQQIQASDRAFAAILADGKVVTWGDPEYGADSREVQDRLQGVQQIQATSCSFAAILQDGSVVTWGSPDHGGDSDPEFLFSSLYTSSYHSGDIQSIINW